MSTKEDRAVQKKYVATSSIINKAMENSKNANEQIQNLLAKKEKSQNQSIDGQIYNSSDKFAERANNL